MFEEADMKGIAARAIGIVVAAAVFQLLPASAQAQPQEQAALNLTLKKTYIKTANNSVPLHPFDPVFGMADAFTPTIVSCVGAGSCVAQVDLSAMFAYLDDDLLFACVYLDGDHQGVLPQWCAQLAPKSTLGGQLTSASGFTWAFPITPGNHEIAVKMSTYGDPSAIVVARSVTISVFKP
jgi:hypothetical protein